MSSAQYARIKLGNQDKISFLSNLGTLLAAGIPLLDAVGSLLEDSKGGQKKVMETLRADLMQGKRIYASLSRFPRAFDKITVNLIRAAEEAGTLEVTLKDLRDHLQQEIEFNDKVRFALLYPLIILFVFIGVMLMMLVLVVPKLTTVFYQLGVTLPLSTRILIFASDLLIKKTFYVIGVGGALAFISYFIYSHKKSFVLNILFSLPLISQLVRQIDLARLSRSLYLLLSSGLPITVALELSAQVVMREQTAKMINRSREMVLSGKKLSEGFRTSKKSLPTIMTRLIEAGEKSGSLDKSFQEISNFLSYQVANSLKTITVLVEPVMLVGIGLAVGTMMMAIIGPIYGLVGQVKFR
ncbi:MAG: Type IV pilin [Candidatus Amesbacteria bacterium GW2011_GWA1_47_16]|uniref:Type II secretion system protein, type IV pilus assembly protein PilC n=4 Tax=Candidatus Amesiibacteriota TaxID=1752730 RepID=A0A0G1UZL1_9BACT|nr:MAG: type II secretion system protein, type IV pilus assembly protein PilC [Candidatus Amesbacteria bacterium GW2011_GWC1_47_15]KKU63189.1 MAG: Type IV pilin [Candidatus Amesbacteria bacterium GW2011_GWA1_47_16]KKU97736.1 MAG: Type IV pilin [Candidatus Amesbacteria bacterium GW2011_GWB1_48_13]OGC99605.1 MAG: hypothetical protein A2972_02495 [Candidatus Amesbacteria bacterium RIFCSPLOWO2_01_FULL_47_33]OGC99880.1 MAG: hypothetical protein A2701_03225 [Candidatus Amesbacteria bacterium RIFCSPHI